MDPRDKRLWYTVAAVIVVLLVIAYAAGWFGGTPTPAPQGIVASLVLLRASSLSNVAAIVRGGFHASPVSSVAFGTVHSGARRGLAQAI